MHNHAIYLSLLTSILQGAAQGGVCFTATIMDRLVLARSGFHHSLNYRCVQPRQHASMPTHSIARYSMPSECVISGCRWAGACNSH